MPKLIAITGFKGHGKSTAAVAVVKAGFIRTRFADPIKQMLYALGLTHAQIEGAEKELPCALLGGKTPRHAMQTLGTEWGRKFFGEDIWANAWKIEADRILGAGHNVVVDDLRFPNEADMVERMGGLIIRVDRPGAPIDLTHESEKHIPSLRPDVFLVNDGEPAKLHEAAVGAIAFAQEVRQ